MNKERILLLVLAVVQFTNIMDFMIMMPLGPQLMRLFQINPQQFGFIVSAYTLSAGVSGFISAFFIDRFDRKRALQIIYTGFTLGTIACGLAPSYEFLVAARILTGLFGGILGAMVLSIVGDVFPQERRGQAVGSIMAAFSLASVFGVPFGLYLANLFSWNAPFLFLGGLSAIISILISFTIPRMKAHLESGRIRESPLMLLKNILVNRNQVRALLLMIALMMGQFTIIPFISAYMVANVGFTEQQLTFIYLLGGAATIITSPIIGRLADRIGKPKVFTIMAALSIIPLFLITHMPPIAIPVVLIVTTSFFILISGRGIPATAMITSTVHPQQRGSFMSINSCVQQLSSGSAAFIAGALVTKNAAGQLEHYNYVGYIAIAFTIICIVLAQKIKAVD